MSQSFAGKIGRYYWESKPHWPEPRRAARGTPNVLLVVLDDVGFAQLGCFGSDVETPVLDRLAANGLRYTGFHTTALCSPTKQQSYRFGRSRPSGSVPAIRSVDKVALVFLPNSFAVSAHVSMQT